MAPLVSYKKISVLHCISPQTIQNNEITPRRKKRTCLTHSNTYKQTHTRTHTHTHRHIHEHTYPDLGRQLKIVPSGHSGVVQPHGVNLVFQFNSEKKHAPTGRHDGWLIYILWHQKVSTMEGHLTFGVRSRDIYTETWYLYREGCVVLHYLGASLLHQDFSSGLL